MYLFLLRLYCPIKITLFALLTTCPSFTARGRLAFNRFSQSCSCYALRSYISPHLFTQSRHKGYRLSRLYTVPTVSPVPSALLHHTRLSSSAGCTTSCTSFFSLPCGGFPPAHVRYFVPCVIRHLSTAPDGNAPRRVADFCQRSTLIFKVHAMPHYTVLRPWAQSALTLRALVCVLLPIAGVKVDRYNLTVSSGYGLIGTWATAILLAS